MRLADAQALRIGGQDALEARLGGQIVWSAQPPDNGDVELSAIIADSFGAGQVGSVYIPRPTVLGQQALWQDSAATIPVIADGDPVGRIDDLSGNNRHATQDVSANRGVYRTSNGLHWIDAAGGAYYRIPALNLNNGAFFVASVSKSTSGTSIFLSGNGAGYFHFRDHNWRKGFTYIDTPARISINASPSQRVNVSGGQVSIRTNDVLQEYTNSAAANTAGFDGVNSIFAYPDGGSSVDMDFYGIMLMEVKVSASQEQRILDYLAGLRQ
ncbi:MULTISPECIES: hypothetical protein [unclassified Halomonas]|uniref:hypothetical protein n=1 Tax=unclassified Halomonas TaxID=2609666 RepID=UPI002076B521|nr:MULTISPECIES: hypothetical protein [unclassified Halomonas]